jgi:hypothetical protein
LIFLSVVIFNLILGRSAPLPSSLRCPKSSAGFTVGRDGIVVRLRQVFRVGQLKIQRGAAREDRLGMGRGRGGADFPEECWPSLERDFGESLRDSKAKQSRTSSRKTEGTSLSSAGYDPDATTRNDKTQKHPHLQLSPSKFQNLEIPTGQRGRLQPRMPTSGCLNEPLRRTFSEMLEVSSCL